MNAAMSVEIMGVLPCGLCSHQINTYGGVWNKTPNAGKSFDRMAFNPPEQVQRLVQSMPERTDVIQGWKIDVSHSHISQYVQ